MVRRMLLGVNGNHLEVGSARYALGTRDMLTKKQLPSFATLYTSTAALYEYTPACLMGVMESLLKMVSE